MEQMTIFDFMPVSSLDDLPEAEMVEEVGRRIGKRFEMVELPGYRKKIRQYKLKQKNIELTLDGYSTYDTGDERDGKRMILVGWGNKKENSGGGAPCDDIEEAVRYFESILRREAKR